MWGSGSAGTLQRLKIADRELSALDLFVQGPRNRRAPRLWGHLRRHWTADPEPSHLHPRNGSAPSAPFRRRQPVCTGKSISRFGRGADEPTILKPCLSDLKVSSFKPVRKGDSLWRAEKRDFPLRLHRFYRSATVVAVIATEETGESGQGPRKPESNATGDAGRGSTSRYGSTPDRAADRVEARGSQSRRTVTPEPLETALTW